MTLTSTKTLWQQNDLWRHWSDQDRTPHLSLGLVLRLETFFWFRRRRRFAVVVAVLVVARQILCGSRALKLEHVWSTSDVTTGASLLSKQIFAVIQSEEVTCNQLDHARTTTLDRTSKTVRLWRGNRLQQVKMSCAVQTNTTPASTNETREHNKYSNADQSPLIPTNRILRTTQVLNNLSAAKNTDTQISISSMYKLSWCVKTTKCLCCQNYEEQVIVCTWVCVTQHKAVMTCVSFYCRETRPRNTASHWRRWLNYFEKFFPRDTQNNNNNNSVFNQISASTSRAANIFNWNYYATISSLNYHCHHMFSCD